MKLKSHKNKHIKSNKLHKHHKSHKINDNKNNKIINKVNDKLIDNDSSNRNKINEINVRNKFIETNNLLNNISYNNISSSEISRVFNNYKTKNDKTNESLIKACILIYPNQLVNIHKLRKIILPQTCIILYEDPFFFNKQVNNNKLLFHKLSFNYYYKKLEKIYKPIIKYIDSETNITSELLRYKTIYTYYQPELQVTNRLFKLCFNNKIKLVTIDSPSYLMNNVIINNLIDSNYINSYKNITYNEVIKFITDEYDLPDYDLLINYLNYDENKIDEVKYSIIEDIKHKDTLISDINIDNSLIDLHRNVRIKYSSIDDKHIRELYTKNNIQFDSKFYLPFTHTHAIDIFKKFLYNYLIKDEVTITKYINNRNILYEDINKINLCKLHLYESFIFIMRFSLDNCLILPDYIINKTMRVYNARSHEIKNKSLVLLNIIKFVKLLICEREFINTKNEYKFINFYDKFYSNDKDIIYNKIDTEYNIFIEIIEHIYNISINNREILKDDRGLTLYNDIVNILINTGFITDSNLLFCISYITIKSNNKQSIVNLLSKSINFSVLHDKWIFSNNFLHSNKHMIDHSTNKYNLHKYKYNNLHDFSKYINNKPYSIGELNKYKLIMSFDQLISRYSSFIKYINNNEIEIILTKNNNIYNFLLTWFILYYEFIRNNINDTYMNTYSVNNFNRYNKLKFSTKSNMIKLANNTKFVLSY
jgi:hypothetical protein